MLIVKLTDFAESNRKVPANPPVVRYRAIVTLGGFDMKAAGAKTGDKVVKQLEYLAKFEKDRDNKAAAKAALSKLGK